MITSNIKYRFGGKVGTIETSSIRCMVSTAKASLFQRQSTRVLDCEKGISLRILLATFHYNNKLTSSERLELHDSILEMIDKEGMKGRDLFSALEVVSTKLLEHNLASMDVHMPFSPGQI